jgi:hypothetical protein
MTVSVNGTTGITFNDASIQNTAATGFGFKNRIINGAMVIDQRNAGASVTIGSAGNLVYTLDRWAAYCDQNSKFSVQQNAGSVTPPVGFSNYLGVTSLSAYSVGSSETFGIQQSIEGFNTADLNWGTASANTIAVSFWVRSSLTGTFGGALRNSANTRSYPFSYTINSANTWEQKSITIVGDTTGTWLTNNGASVKIWFSLGTGSTYSGTAGSWAGSNLLSTTGATSVVGTNGATFYITGVQLEKGSTATSFDYRPYGTELALCQRYAQKITSDATAVYARYGSGFCYATTTIATTIPFKVSMRATPSLTTTGTATNYAIYNGAGVVSICNAVPVIGSLGTTTEVADVQASVASGLTVGQGAILLSNNTANSYLLFTAEL